MEMNKKMLAILPCTLVAAAASGQSVDQERAYQSELLADANSRTSLLQGAGGSAGYQDGFVISDATGDNTMKINALSQFRYDWNSRNDDSAPGVNDKQTVGFQIPRAWMNFSGNVINKNIGYQIRIETNGIASGNGPLGSGANGMFYISDAFSTYKMDDNWTFRWGQFRPALSREGMVDDQNQQGIERSFIDTDTGYSSRVQGIDFNYTDDQFRFWVGFNDGFATQGTDITSSVEADYAFQGRFEWMFKGDDWSRFDQFSSYQNSDNAAMAGVSAWYQSGGETNGTVDGNVTIIIADFSWEGDGWNAFAQYAGVNTDFAAAGGSNFDNSFLVQGGYFFTEQVEAYGQWTTIIPDDGGAGRTPANTDTFNTLTLGANYYFVPNSQAAKASADVQIYLNKTTSSSSVVFTPNTLAPVFASPDDGQFAIRLQMQMFF